MKVDLNHKDFPEYRRKFELLKKQMEEEIDALEPIEAKVLDRKDKLLIHKKYARMMKELQREYRHVYVDDE